jgi:hypothetical protein
MSCILAMLHNRPRDPAWNQGAVHIKMAAGG